MNEFLGDSISNVVSSGKKTDEIMRAAAEIISFSRW